MTTAQFEACTMHTHLSVSLAITRCEIFMMITIGRQVGEALVLAPLPFPVANVEVNLHRAGYSLVPVGWDLHNKSALQRK